MKKLIGLVTLVVTIMFGFTPQANAQTAPATGGAAPTHNDPYDFGLGNRPTIIVPELFSPADLVYAASPMAPSELCDIVGNDRDAYNSNCGAVARYYQAVGRFGDVAGMRYWTKLMDQGWTGDDVMAAMLTSAEFGFLDEIWDDEFINFVYWTVLGRPIDSSGFLYWLGQLTSGEVTRNQMIRLFADSPENVGYSYQEYLWHAKAARDGWNMAQLELVGVVVYYGGCEPYAHLGVECHDIGFQIGPPPTPIPAAA